MPEYPPSLLAMTRLRQALAALQAQLDGKDPVETPAAHLAQVCEDIEQAVIEAICHLAYGQLSLQSVLDLLDYLDDDVRLPPSRLHELLLPLDKRMEQSLAQLIRVL
ncbi:DUF1484 family protein [Chromobacterium sp. CV08]|uniref:DUF1484 family protein n=1 Tax=Chromobacterium sp. CV08 TaxID=3133274 RepID=UPI003DA863E3